MSPQFTGNAAELLLASQSEDNATQGACAVIGSGSGNALYSGDTAAGKPLLQFAANGTLWDIVRSQISTSSVTTRTRSRADHRILADPGGGDIQVGSQYEVEVPFAGKSNPGGNRKPPAGPHRLSRRRVPRLLGDRVGILPLPRVRMGRAKVRPMRTATGVTGTVIMWLDGGLGNAGTRSSGTSSDAAYCPVDGADRRAHRRHDGRPHTGRRGGVGSPSPGRPSPALTSTLTRTGP